MNKPRDPRKTPTQARSRATRDAILEAAARILEGRLAVGFTTNHIAEAAGVSVGTLYQYFPGKDAILAMLIRTMREGMLQDFREALSGVDPTDLPSSIEAGIRAALRHHVARPALAEALEAAERQLPLDQELLAIKYAMHQLVVAILRRHAIPEPETCAKDVVAIAQGMAEAAIRSGETDIENLFRRIRRAISGYLAPQASTTLSARS